MKGKPSDWTIINSDADKTNWIIIISLKSKVICETYKMPMAMNEAKINNNLKQLSLRDIANIISIAVIFSSFSV